MPMDFINWTKEVNYLLYREHKLINKPTLIDSYKYYRNNYNPREAATYLSNILYYKDLDF
jgi:hypothetical protein